MKWKPELILNGLIIVSMKIEHMLFIDSASYLPMPLCKLPEALGLSLSKSCYPHYFNSKTNLDYVGPFPDISYFGAEEMSPSERREFMTWYNGQKNKVLDNKLLLQIYCHDDFTVLRHSCQTFRREFKEIGIIKDFVESFAIPSACNKFLRKRFLKPGTIGFIPDGGYICNNNYSKKILMLLVHMEQTDGCQIMQARIGREKRLPELTKFSVDGYGPETKTIYEFFCFFFTCQPFQDVSTTIGDTAAE